VCHALLADIKFFQQLVQIDLELANQTRLHGCPCGGPLHQAHFPRKPRSCPAQVRDDFAKRFSFCCAWCRRRVTAVSVRFLGRRVHLALAVVLVSDRGPTPAAARRLAQQLPVTPRTVERWRQWWRDSFPASQLWQAMCARFMPPPDLAQLPAGLLSRFPGPCNEAMLRLLMFLTPLSGTTPVTLREGR
jgi:hypothetical protein